MPQAFFNLIKFTIEHDHHAVCGGLNESDPDKLTHLNA